MLNLGWEIFAPDRLEYYEKINFLKGGIVFADLISRREQTLCEERKNTATG